MTFRRESVVTVTRGFGKGFGSRTRVGWTLLISLVGWGAGACSDRQDGTTAYRRALESVASVTLNGSQYSGALHIDGQGFTSSNSTNTYQLAAGTYNVGSIYARSESGNTALGSFTVAANGAVTSNASLASSFDLTGSGSSWTLTPKLEPVTLEFGAYKGSFVVHGVTYLYPNAKTISLIKGAEYALGALSTVSLGGDGPLSPAGYGMKLTASGELVLAGGTDQYFTQSGTLNRTLHPRLATVRFDLANYPGGVTINGIDWLPASVSPATSDIVLLDKRRYSVGLPYTTDDATTLGSYGLAVNGSNLSLSNGLERHFRIVGGNVRAQVTRVRFQRNGYQGILAINGILWLPEPPETDLIVGRRYNLLGGDQITVPTSGACTPNPADVNGAQIGVDCSVSASPTVAVEVRRVAGAATSPVPGVWVNLYQGATWMGNALADANGVATLTLPGEGPYRFQTQWYGGQFFSAPTPDCTPASCPNRTITVSGVEVTVLKPDGSPFESRWVNAYVGGPPWSTASATWVANGLTDGSGIARIALPASATYRFHTSSTGVDHWSLQDCPVPSCSTATIQIAAIPAQVALDPDGYTGQLCIEGQGCVVGGMTFALPPATYVVTAPLTQSPTGSVQVGTFTIDANHTVVPDGELAARFSQPTPLTLKARTVVVTTDLHDYPGAITWYGVGSVTAMDNVKKLIVGRKYGLLSNDSYAAGSNERFFSPNVYGVTIATTAATSPANAIALDGETTKSFTASTTALVVDARVAGANVTVSPSGYQQPLCVAGLGCGPAGMPATFSLIANRRYSFENAGAEFVVPDESVACQASTFMLTSSHQAEIELVCPDWLNATWDMKKMWDLKDGKYQVHVCFQNFGPEASWSPTWEVDKARARAALNGSWPVYSSVEFIFEPDCDIDVMDPKPVENKSWMPITLQFHGTNPKAAGGQAEIGVGARLQNRCFDCQVTVAYGTDYVDFEPVLIHEVGHALGLLHERSRTSYPLLGCTNLDNNMPIDPREVLRPGTIPITTMLLKTRDITADWDRYSIMAPWMCYENRFNARCDPATSPCPIDPFRVELSYGDQVGINMAYPTSFFRVATLGSNQGFRTGDGLVVSSVGQLVTDWTASGARPGVFGEVPMWTIGFGAAFSLFGVELSVANHLSPGSNLVKWEYQDVWRRTHKGADVVIKDDAWHAAILTSSTGPLLDL